LSIINYCQEPKIIENLFHSLTDKSNNLRSKCAMYLNIILQSWPEYILEKFLGSPQSGSFKAKKNNRGHSHK